MTFLGLAACAPQIVPEKPAPPAGPERLTLSPAAFSDLPGWAEDDLRPAAAAFVRSCRRLRTLPPDRVMTDAVFGRIGDWMESCAALEELDRSDRAGVRKFFETRFRPFLVTGRDGASGLFTGYFEYALDGAREKSARYAYPLYRRPDDLVTVDLGNFGDEFRGRYIAGQVRDGRLAPYADRGEIDRGALAGQGLELVWVDDPVDAFFLHIQGSGRVRLPDGGEMRVGFAARNGHPYRSIGRELVARGEMTLDSASMQSIRAWLTANPDKAADLLAHNRSYVFFRELPGEGPIGAQGVPLTARRSIAVDRAFLPMGLPLYVAADNIQAPPTPPRLMIAQDTGSAIRGVIRGDLYMGSGDAAGEEAGRMKFPGRYWALLPTGTAGRLAARH